MPIDDPPFLEHLLLEQPWPLLIALAAAGIGMFLVASRRSDTKFRFFGIGCFALAVLAAATAWFVDTDREQVISLTRQLVHQTAPFQDQAVRSHFDPNAVILQSDGSNWYPWRVLMDKVQDVIKRFGIAEHTIRSIAAEIGTAGTVRCWVRIHTSIGGRPAVTEWLLTWKQQDDGQWRVTILQALKLNEQPFPRHF